MSACYFLEFLAGAVQPFLGRAKRRIQEVLAPDALTALNAHRWPGNVRELRNVIERSLAFEPMPPVPGAEHLRITL